MVSALIDGFLPTYGRLNDLVNALFLDVNYFQVIRLETIKKKTLSALFEQCKVDYRLDKVTNDKIEMSSFLHTHTHTHAKKKRKIFRFRKFCRKIPKISANRVCIFGCNVIFNAFAIGPKLDDASNYVVWSMAK